MGTLLLSRRMRRWMALLTAMVLATGCAGVKVPGGGAHWRADSSFGRAPMRQGRTERASAASAAMASPAGVAVRTVSGGLVQLDAFESLWLRAGLEGRDSLSDEAPLTRKEAARRLAVLLRAPVSLAAFPPRMAVGFLLRESLEGGDVSRDELLHRVARFENLAVLRPDGCLAWVLSGNTQQRAGPVEWKDEAFRAGPFELGRFYSARGGVFRDVDAQLRPLVRAPPLADVHDDADAIGRTLDGAQEAFVELFHATGQFLTRPVDGLAALRHLPAGVVALIASSPEYLERLRYMTRGEQIKALSKLTTQLITTLGAAGGSTSTLTRAFAGAEATVPVLSLSAEGVLAVERIAVPVGKVATVLSGGSGAVIILQRVNAAGQTPSPAPGPGQWGPAHESMSARARAYQEQITGHSADDAYWLGGMSTQAGGVRFDGFKNGVLLEAKGPGYANKFLDNLAPKDWFKHTGARELLKQAKRQLGAVRGTRMPIQWHIAEEKTAEAIRLLLSNEDVVGIEVLYTPML